MLKIVKNVKNHISAMLKNEDFIEIFDIDDNSVIFQISSIDQLVDGVTAQPDGDYLFSDGMHVVVSCGKVTKVEKPEPVVEPEAEPVVEPEPEAVVEPEQEQEPVSELQAKIAELESKITELESKIVEKDKDIDEAKNCLVEVQNFYTKISNPNERTANNEDNVKSIFKIKNK